jgi:multiple sugar transport system permease protein
MSTTALPATTAAAEYEMTAPPKNTNRGKLVRGYIGLVLIVIWGLAPFYWMIVTAFRNVGFTFDTTPWPTHVTLDNFKTAFSTSRGNHFGQALLNSLIIGVVTTAIAMLVGVFAAYALSRMNFPFKYGILGVILGASMFPGVALVSPLFSLFSNLNWLSGWNYQAMIIPDISFALPLAIYTLTAFFGELPWDLEEAARIDGCTPGQAFRKVMLPLAAPGLFTTAILTFISAWNEYLLSSQFSNSDPHHYTQPVTVAIASFAGAQPHQEPYTAVMAAGAIVTVPLIIMVLVFQRAIVSGLTAGGVKG